MSNRFTELAALYAAGALSSEERLAFRELLQGASTAERAECAAMQNAAAAIVTAVNRADPPHHSRPALLRRIESLSGRDDLDGFSFVAAHEGWKPYPALPGIWLKELASDPAAGTVTLLARLAPNTAFPTHDHSGAEQTLVLTGDLQSGGRRLGPGDYFFAAAGSHHPDVYSENGCTALLIVSARDYAGL